MSNQTLPMSAAGVLVEAHAGHKAPFALLCLGMDQSLHFVEAEVTYYLGPQIYL